MFILRTLLRFDSVSDKGFIRGVSERRPTYKCVRGGGPVGQGERHGYPYTVRKYR